VTRAGATLDEENRATAGLLERVTRRGRVMLTGCTVDGRFLGRVCVLSFRTRQAQIDACMEDVAAELPSVWGDARRRRGRAEGPTWF
jgi:aromatic-L-amino-acid decarboxylase